VLEAEGEVSATAAAYERAWRRFDGLLEELVGHLPVLRQQVEREAASLGPVAQRMVTACLAHAPRFITPMAAVAGAVADEILLALCEGGDLRRAYVNNGGDIAFHLVAGEQFRVGLATEGASRHGRRAALEGAFEIEASMPVRGIATSGWRGRSLSLGIADSVTVLAATGAVADAAATMVANAVDIEHPSVRRAPASSVVDDTDLGDHLVTLGVDPLERAAIDMALDAGAAVARGLVGQGIIWGAVLLLQGRRRVVGGAGIAIEQRT